MTTTKVVLAFKARRRRVLATAPPDPWWALWRHWPEERQARWDRVFAKDLIWILRELMDQPGSEAAPPHTRRRR
jgi:hypothetical protein